MALRLLHVCELVGSLGEAQVYDAAYYHDLALVILGRQSVPGLETNVAFANIGYPYVLAAVYAAVESPTAMLVVQSLVGAATTVLVGELARRLSGRRAVGLVSAGLYVPCMFRRFSMTVCS